MNSRASEVSVADLEIDQEKENNLFNQWKKSQDKQAFQQLYTSMKPLLDSAARKASFGSNLPKSAHEIYAAQNFMDSLKTFDPNKGVRLQTHVYGAVHQKAKRLNYKYQNLGHIPEPRAAQIGVFTTVRDNLQQDLGREPSAAEIADTMNTSLKDVQRLQREIQRDLSLSSLEEQAITVSPQEEEVLTYLYYELSNEEKVVYDYIFGKHGKPAMIKPTGKIDFDRIAANMGVSVSKVRSLYTSIRSKFEKASR